MDQCNIPKCNIQKNTHYFLSLKKCNSNTYYETNKEKMLEKLPNRCHHKWVGMKNVLMKLNYVFLIEHGKSLKAYNKIGDEIGNIVQNGFDRKQVYNKKYLWIKIKSYSDEINKFSWQQNA